MHPRSISIHDYSYSLPPEKIAHYPLPERDSSKLLIWQEGNVQEDIYFNIATHIPPNSLVIFNNSKVIASRLLFQKPSGGVVEIFCLEPHEQYADITTAMHERRMVNWQCLVGGASKWKTGQVLEKKISSNNQAVTLQAHYLEKCPGCFIVSFTWNTDDTFAEVLSLMGAVPLPPYIKRAADAADTERYQTVYAKSEGSVAAPTAGLHFTPAIFDSFRKKKIGTAFVTLHVGAGTFKPVKAEQMKDHDMHAEWIDVDLPTIETILQSCEKTIVAAGTTSLRTIESLYWLGCRAHAGKSIDIISQWEAYESNSQIPVQQSLEALIKKMKTNNTDRLIAQTQIMIAPGYQFRIVDGLITNFHQPQSTLLLLVAAFVGKRWKEIYDYALGHHFRFLSYGDGSLLWKEGRNA